MNKNKEQWQKVRALNIEESISLGPIYTEFLLSDPKCFGFVLSRYKFAAKMLARKTSILEVGCGEGIGTMMLACETRASVLGIDFDPAQIAYANSHLREPFVRHRPGDEGRLAFACGDFVNGADAPGGFDGLVSLDVIEHVPRGEEEDRFLRRCRDCLGDGGVAVIGTPNLCAAAYASERSKIGHINLFDPDRYVGTLEQYFANVFVFSMNDEMVHTGFYKMAHYLMAVCVK